MKQIVLKDVFTAIIDDFRDNERWGSAHIYQSALNAFLAFSGNPRFKLKDLSPAVLKHFEQYLRKRNCSWNTVATYMRSLRSAYNRCVDIGRVPYVPRLFEHVHTGARTNIKRALDTSDLKRLLAWIDDGEDDCISPDVRKAGVIFALMFLLRGLPFVDLAFLRKTDLCGNVLVYRRKKTGRLLTVVLPSEAIRLMVEIENQDRRSPYLFSIIGNWEDQEKAYREYQSALRFFNYKLVELGRYLGIGAHLSTYAARHSWATLAYHCEIHPGIISEAMGHSSIAVTETYLKPFQDERIDEANKQIIAFVKR